jgi:hypothetical protein
MVAKLHFLGLVIWLSNHPVIGWSAGCKVSTDRVIDYCKYVGRKSACVGRMLRHSYRVEWVVFILAWVECVTANCVVCLKSLFENYTTRRNGCTYPPRSAGGETSRNCSLRVSLGLVLLELTLSLGKWQLMFSVFLWTSLYLTWPALWL